jgi:hypothetical protein
VKAWSRQLQKSAGHLAAESDIERRHKGGICRNSLCSPRRRKRGRTPQKKAPSVLSPAFFL